MAFNINTNIASLQAQQYLRTNSDFQSKTINRVTSGLRIISSGDDAAGLAIANSYRSDQAVLTQGVRNANDGLSQLQIADGGINNISQLLDRARTLATQSASGTFTGDRSLLNSEFQSVIGEIDRQAQVIGLNQGGTFAKSLSVFIGGGTDASNGSVSVDLSNSTVDAKSLGLQGVQVSGVAGTDIGTGSTTTSVAKILADATNTNSEGIPGYTDFYFSGPGFSGADKVKASVNLSGVTDTDTLVTAINTAIQNAGNGGTQAATAFQNAAVTAAINTDSNGKKQLTFNSSSAAFQVQAGDRVANAFMGNFTAGADGKDLTYTVTGTGVTAAGSLSQNVIIRVQGSGLAAPVDLQLASGITTANALITLSSLVANNAALQAAGITLSGAGAVGSTLTFTSKRGETLNVSTVGDVGNLLKLGTDRNATDSGTAFDYTDITAGAAYNAATGNAVTVEFSVAGGTAQSISVTVTTADAIGVTVNQLNTAIAANSTLNNSGLQAISSGGKIEFQSANGTAFRANVTADTNNVLGFGTTLGAAGNATLTAAAADNTDNVHFDAGGSSATAALNFSPILFGQDQQTLTFSANDSSGVAHSASVVLSNNATTRNARSLDEAIATINSALQQSNDSTLQQITAVKEYDATNHVDQIAFVSTLSKFSVGVGTAGTGSAAGVTSSQGTVVSSATTAGGSTADIGSQGTAQTAVAALATAVSTLGSAQAVVGRGENQLGYAVNLAQSQLTNMAAAESRIRDADLASEAANLTKSQILLQAGIAALAQANSAPQQVLTLLRG